MSLFSLSFSLKIVVPAPALHRRRRRAPQHKQPLRAQVGPWWRLGRGRCRCRCRCRRPGGPDWRWRHGPGAARGRCCWCWLCRNCGGAAAASGPCSGRSRRGVHAARDAKGGAAREGLHGLVSEGRAGRGGGGLGDLCVRVRVSNAQELMSELDCVFMFMFLFTCGLRTSINSGGRLPKMGLQIMDLKR